MSIYSQRSYMINRAIIAFAACLLNLGLFAQLPSDSVFKNLQSGNELVLSVQPPPQLLYKISSSKVYLKFSVGEDYKLGLSGSTTFSVKLKFRIGENSITSGSSEISIDLDNKSPEQVYVYNVGTKPSELSTFNVLITEITVPPAVVTNVAAYVLQNMQVAVSYTPELKIDVRKEEGGTALAPVINQLPQGIWVKNRVQTFSWENNETEDFPNYEFQLLRLYNTNEATSSNSRIITSEVDWNKALRIETESPSKSLTITVAEGSGYYIWRVRPIGSYYEGGITDKRNYGEWSDAPIDGKIENIQSLASSYNCIFYLDDPEENLNWTYSRVFTEQNKVRESMTYANGLFHVKQTQSYLPSKDTTLIAQTITDYSGRPALQTLPVPVGGRIDSYKQKFVTTNDSLYTAKHFDDSTFVSTPAQIDSSSFFEYYSDSNKDLFIPSSEGYSYSRTLYEDAPQGKSIEQSGAGKIHAIGKQTDGMGRTTRIVYCKPSDEELIRIFGDEALPASAVLKTITIDPNNTASVSYTSTNGKVIATCMVYNNEDEKNLKDIDHYKEADGYPDISNSIITEEIRDNFKTINGFVSAKRLILSYPSALKIKYNVPYNSTAIGCTRIDVDCEYVVSFSIRKEGTDTVWESPNIYLKGLKAKDTTWIPPVAKFSKGAYIITKKIQSTANRLKPNVHARLDASLDPVKNISDVIYAWLSKVQTDRQMLLFYEDIQKLAELIDVGINSNYNYSGIRNYKFKLGNVSLPDSAYFLKYDNEKRSITLMIDPPYVAANAQYPKMIIIRGGCCGDVVIPVIIQPQTVCYTSDELRADPSLSPNFWGYLRQTLIVPWGEQYGLAMTNVPGKKNIMAGYDSIALNKMVYYMLTDKYYTGPTMVYQGKVVKTSDSTEITSKDKKEQYTCSELWSCWKSIVNAYNDILSNNYTEGLGSVHKGMHDEQAEEGKSNPDSTKDNQFDEGSNKFGGFFFKVFLKRKLSKRMRDAENVGAGGDTTNMGDPIDFQFKVMEQFLNCAGFRFAGIVEKNGNQLTGVLDEDKIKEYNYTDSRYHFDSADFVFANDPAILFPGDSLVLPYIKNPMYAFKYFQYDDDLSITKSPCRKWLNEEVARCYDNYATMFTDVKFCENKCGPRTHMDWNAYERYLFYTSIKNKKLPELAPEDNMPDPANIEEQIDSMATAAFNSMKSNCNSMCNKRRDEVERLVKQAFEDNCYILNGCPEDSSVVQDRDINEIVDNIIEKCISDCKNIFVRDSLRGYPKIDKDPCRRLNQLGTAWEVVYGEPYAVILDDTARHQYDVLEKWQFVFALDDKYSRCKYLDRFNGNILNSVWSVLDKDDWEQTEAYTANNLVLSSKGKNSEHALYVLRDDVADTFDISVKIDSLKIELLAGDQEPVSGTFAFCGIVALNNSERTDSAFVGIGVTSTNKLFYATDTITYNVVDATITYPCYLRLSRDGNEFKAYYKLNPLDSWTWFKTITYTLSDNPPVGLFNSGGRTTYHVTSAFDDFYGGRKLPNRLNNNNTWINNKEKSYPIYDPQGFPKKYYEPHHEEITIDPE